MKLGLSILVIAFGLSASVDSTLAGSATWLANPGSGDWNAASNWTPGGPPSAQPDIATFDSSTVSNIWLSADTSVSGITFNSGGGTPYTINVSSGLGFFGSGITNNSGIMQNFMVPYGISFANNASAGSNTSFTVSGGPGFFRPEVLFFHSSTAGNATFTINGSTQSDNDSGGDIAFYEHPCSAGNATIIVNGSAFRHIDSAIDTPYPAGFLVFFGATAGNSTLIANGGIGTGDGGAIGFSGNATGGTARIKVFGNGNLNISTSVPPFDMTIGSLEGDGIVFLGGRTLNIGSNNLSTTFSGLLTDNNNFGPGLPSGLTKIGSGTLTLAGANAYTGTTTINGGTLIAAHDGALGRNVSLTASSVTLALQNGATNNYITDAASLSIVSGSTVNLNFTGTADTIGFLRVDGIFQAPGLYGSAASGATNQLPQLTGPGELLVVPPPQLLDISTRTRVLAGDKVLIGGFIITGTEPKRVLIRGIGPSLSGVEAGGALADPTLELHRGSSTISTNDNWKTTPNGVSQQAEIEATTIPPTNDLESAILATLSPGAYTAILAGTNGGTGVGLVEVYDLAREANSKVANISTRGFVDTGDSVMIGGLIVSGSASVIVRALGPSVSVADALGDPILELRDGSGTLVASNDNWKTRPDGSSQQAEIEATSIPPPNDLESALVRTLAPDNYTAIVRGLNDTTGVGLVEVYHLQ